MLLTSAAMRIRTFAFFSFVLMVFRAVLKNGLSVSLGFSPSTVSLMLWMTQGCSSS